MRAKKYPLEIMKLSDESHHRAGEGFIRELVNEYYVKNRAMDTEECEQKDDR